MNLLIRTLIFSSLVAVLGANLGFLAQVAGAESKSPNIVVIFMDDMAYADIGPFGSKSYPTPNLDHGQRRA